MNCPDKSCKEELSSNCVVANKTYEFCEEGRKDEMLNTVLYNINNRLCKATSRYFIKDILYTISEDANLKKEFCELSCSCNCNEPPVVCTTSSYFIADTTPLSPLMEGTTYLNAGFFNIEAVTSTTFNPDNGIRLEYLNTSGAWITLKEILFSDSNWQTISSTKRVIHPSFGTYQGSVPDIPSFVPQPNVNYTYRIVMMGVGENVICQNKQTDQKSQQVSSGVEFVQTYNMPGTVHIDKDGYANKLIVDYTIRPYPDPLGPYIASDFVRIQYSTDNGTTWNLLEDIYHNNSGYTNVTPNDKAFNKLYGSPQIQPGNTYKIRALLFFNGINSGIVYTALGSVSL